MQLHGSCSGQTGQSHGYCSGQTVQLHGSNSGQTGQLHSSCSGQTGQSHIVSSQSIQSGQLHGFCIQGLQISHCLDVPVLLSQRVSHPNLSHYFLCNCSVIFPKVSYAVSVTLLTIAMPLLIVSSGLCEPGIL